MSSYFKSLDFDQYVKAQWGSNASVVCLNDHLFGWRLQLNGQQYNLDIDAAAKWQYGSNFKAVATGVHKYDWCAINFSQISWMIIPVVVVANDKMNDIEGVKRACNHMLNGLDLTRSWFANRLGGKSFSYLEKCLIIYSADKADKWEEFAAITDVADTVLDSAGNPIPNPKDSYPSEENRYILYYRLKHVLKSAFGNINTNSTTVCIAPYTGKGMSASGAGAAAGDFVIGEPPLILEFDPKTIADTGKRDGVIYAIGHELGHIFGLGHSCTVYPGNKSCRLSIMENPSNNFSNAILLNEELPTLLACPFIK